MSSEYLSESQPSYDIDGEFAYLNLRKSRDDQRHHSGNVLLETLLSTAYSNPSPASLIASSLLFSPQAEVALGSTLSSTTASITYQMNATISQRYGVYKALPTSADSLLHIIALKNAVSSLQQSRRNFLHSSLDLADQSFAYRDFTNLLYGIGSLLAITSDPAASYALVDVRQLLLLSIHILTICEIDSHHVADKDALESLTFLCGALFSSHLGIQEMMSSFDDAELERVWLRCLLGDVPLEHDLITELRRMPGVLSLAEEIQKMSLDIDTSPSIALSRLDIGILTATLLDSWRASQSILRLQLGDMEQICRHSETISHACLDLAKLCAYDSGREALCAVVIDSTLPMFLIALEKHSNSQSVCETARYLTIQIFHTAVQYRSILSQAGEDTLVQLFRHIEPAGLSPLLFSGPYENIPSPHINALLALIDNPPLLWTNVNYACQLCVALSILSTECTIPARSAHFIAVLSELRLPYSSHALVCAALDETVNALSVLIHGEDLVPGHLRYAKPPFPLLATERPANRPKIVQQSDTKIFVFRSATYLCDLLLHLYQFYNDQFENERNSSNRFMDERSIRYMVNACIRAIHVSRGFEGSPLSLARKLERAALKILSRLASIEFLPDVTSTSCTDQNITKLVFQGVLNEGRYSPRNCDTVTSIITFLMTDWMSGDILINNRLTSCLRDSLRGFGPEISELLLMWDGNCEQTQWLLTCGPDASCSIWNEVFSRVEFWLLRGHSRYTLKWLSVLRELLARSTDRGLALLNLENALVEREVGLSFDKWIERVSAMLPEAEVEAFEEIECIYALCRELASAEEIGVLMEQNDVDDLIYVNCTDYLEDMTSQEFAAIHQRSASPSYWRERLSPEQGQGFTDEVQKPAGSNLVSGGLWFRNGGGGKIYVQNEFRSAHGASRNTSRAPSVHVDDFYSNN